MIARQATWPMILASLLFAGCAVERPSLQSPRVELRGVEAESLSLDRQSFVLHFEANNPNAIPLPVRSIDYKLFLDRQPFASGKTAGQFTIPADGSRDFSIGVELDLMSSTTRLVSLLRNAGSRSLEYDLHGSLAVAVPFAPPLAFSHSGTIVVH